MKLPLWTSIFNSLLGRRAVSGPLTCRAAEALLRLHVDTMAVNAGPDAARFELHMAECPSCRGEYESFAAMRSFLLSSQRPSVPTRLEMETRVKLSHARQAETAVGWAAYAIDLVSIRGSVSMSPIGYPDLLRLPAIRAVLSASASMVLFGALALGLVSNQSAIAHRGPDPSLQTYKRAQPTELTKAWLVGSEDYVEELKEPPLLVVFVHGHSLQSADEMELLKEPLQLEVYVGADGSVLDFRVVEGVQTPETDRWVWDRLYWARFSPGTSFGVPVKSSVMLSFCVQES